MTTLEKKLLKALEDALFYGELYSRCFCPGTENATKNHEAYLLWQELTNKEMKLIGDSHPNYEVIIKDRR
jgi:hypothetical protein